MSSPHRDGSPGTFTLRVIHQWQFSFSYLALVLAEISALISCDSLNPPVLFLQIRGQQCALWLTSLMDLRRLIDFSVCSVYNPLLRRSGNVSALIHWTRNKRSVKVTFCLLIVIWIYFFLFLQLSSVASKSLRRNGNRRNWGWEQRLFLSPVT